MSPEEQFFWDGVAERRLLLAKCATCSRLQHPPAPMCPRCGSTDWAVHQASGRGRVHSWIVSHHPSDADASPRIVALVELEEGVRLVSNLRDVEVADVGNEMAVELTFADVDGTLLPQFRPARAASTL